MSKSVQEWSMFVYASWWSRISLQVFNVATSAPRGQREVWAGTERGWRVLVRLSMGIQVLWYSHSGFLTFQMKFKFYTLCVLCMLLKFLNPKDLRNAFEQIGMVSLGKRWTECTWHVWCGNYWLLCRKPLCIILQPISKPDATFKWKCNSGIAVLGKGGINIFSNNIGSVNMSQHYDLGTADRLKQTGEQSIVRCYHWSLP